MKIENLARCNERQKKELNQRRKKWRINDVMMIENSGRYNKSPEKEVNQRRKKWEKTMK